MAGYRTVFTKTRCAHTLHSSETSLVYDCLAIKRYSRSLSLVCDILTDENSFLHITDRHLKTLRLHRILFFGRSRDRRRDDGQLSFNGSYPAMQNHSEGRGAPFPLGWCKPEVQESTCGSRRTAEAEQGMLILPFAEI